jgi:hypothetical protein
MRRPSAANADGNPTFTGRDGRTELAPSNRFIRRAA